MFYLLSINHLLNIFSYKHCLNSLKSGIFIKNVNAEVLPGDGDQLEKNAVLDSCK